MINNLTAEILNEIEEMVGKYNKIEKMAFNFGGKDTLYPAEIHTIEMIGKNSNITITELCTEQGVTKGAVSQVIGKLHKKGYVEKNKSTNNGKEIPLALTAKGEKALQIHRLFHDKIDDDINSCFDKYTDAQLNAFHDMLIEITNQLDKYMQMGK